MVPWEQPLAAVRPGSPWHLSKAQLLKATAQFFLVNLPGLVCVQGLQGGGKTTENSTSSRWKVMEEMIEHVDIPRYTRFLFKENPKQNWF
jgi:hypothetical protein